MRISLPALLLLGVLLSTLITSCRDKTDSADLMSPEQAGRYVLAHTSGVIGSREAIRVQFAQPLGEGKQSAPAGLLRLDPVTGHEGVWTNAYTLEFEPSDNWEAGREYTADLLLNKIVDTLTGPSVFRFNFTIKEQYLRVAVQGLNTPDPQDLTRQVVEGELLLNDRMEAAELSGVLTAEQDGRPLDVEIAEATDGLRLPFVVSGVQRGENPSQVKLNWNAAELNLDTKGEQLLEVPALGDFKVLGVNYVLSDNPHLLINFSDPLQTDQDLNGLIRFVNRLQFTNRIEGSNVLLYLTNPPTGEQTLIVDSGVRNSMGRPIGKSTTWQVELRRPEPAVRSVGEGVVMPHKNLRAYPFEAVGLTGVRVEIFKIFASNVQQFLRANELNAINSWDLENVGRLIAREHINLGSLGTNNDQVWARYALDLDKFVSADQQAIYQVRIGFGMEDVADRSCGKSPADFGLESGLNRPEEIQLGFKTIDSQLDDYPSIYGYYDDYDYNDRDDYCKPGYYNSDHFLKSNVLTSNLGLMAKRGQDRTTVAFVTDLLEAKPLTGATVRFYDAQQQELTSGITDENGSVRVTTDIEPIFLMAENGRDIGYLNLGRAEALSMSRFNVAGVGTEGGIKGEFYAERGVWRPGDSVYLNFVLQDRKDLLPKNYPIRYEVRDPRGRVRQAGTVRAGAGNIYPLYFATGADDLTGAWHTTVNVGGTEFTDYLRIETVKPNRLKIDLDFNGRPLSPDNQRVGISSAWLYGAPAGDLKAVVELELQEDKSGFEDWAGFVFNDPARSVNPEPLTVFDGKLDAGGKASFTIPAQQGLLPGKMRAAFKTRVFEKGGEFSTDNQRTTYLPFSSLAGIQLEENQWGYKSLDMNRTTPVSVAAINPNGRPLAGRNLSVGLYRIEWNWWWENDDSNVRRFSSSQHQEAIQTGNVRTGTNGRATYDVQVDDWGRYLLRVCDTESGHCTGDYFYAGSPPDGGSGQEAALLEIRSDLEKYAVGQTARITVPGGEGGRVLLSLENGTGVLETRWIEVGKGEQTVDVKLDERMSPTVYAHLTLLQPHGQTINNRPIRMYGVIGLSVEDPATHLSPTLETAAKWSPQQTVDVTVAETDGRAMSYTLDVVDEGLLGLTRFQTPDLWETFFAREALGVSTWDMYAYVLGAMSGNFDRVLAIGGDEDMVDGKDKKRANRFEPVVRHLGPFNLPAGKKKTHKITLPNYVGAVRVMLVAENGKAYGSTEKSVPVTKPLMILPSLPRVLGPGETVQVPINVFALEKALGKTTVTLEESNGLATFPNGKSASVTLSEAGDKVATVAVKMNERTGVAKFTITAEGGGERASQIIEIDVRNPNEIQTRTELVTLGPGESKDISYQPFGMVADRTALAEVSTLPSLNLGRHVQYLLGYPYGCIEQTVSKAFAQLYLGELTELSADEQQRSRRAIAAAVSRVQLFAGDGGGFSYWPGDRQAHPWATDYALHFLLEARERGYTVPSSLIDNALNYQSRAAREWRLTTYEQYVNDRQRYLDQSYRLYTLALGNRTELGAMNRLREVKNLPLTARYRLAAAYAEAGKADIGRQLITGVSVDKIEEYQELSYTFGSRLRDVAMVLETYTLLDDQTKAGETALILAREISRQSYLNTQEAAFSLLALGKYQGGAQQQGQLAFDVTLPGAAKKAFGSSEPVASLALSAKEASGTYTVKNTSQRTIYVSTILSGRPLAGEEKASSSNLRIQVAYINADGSEVDVSRLQRGRDFRARVTITNPGSLGNSYQELALNQVFPPGWEIANTRMDVTGGDEANQGYEYRDVRDDRVYTFFDLPNGKSVTYEVGLTATYPGRYYLPAQTCEAMYDRNIQAGTMGRWVEVL